MSTIGDKLGGRYTLTERIAAGGMGEVWKAEDEILGRIVAVKLLKSGLTDEVGFTERFRNEARLSAALTHGNIAQVYDYGEEDGKAYLVMEFVPGMPLSKIIADNAPISAADTAGLMSQAASALNAAHKAGLIHRDVKPANMLVTADGVVKLTDFGIARAIGSAAMTKTGEVMGTAQYLAPEAALGKEVTPLSDIYALAVVTHEMLSGRRPFEADSPVTLALMHVNQEAPPLPGFVPPPVRAVVRAGLEKDPTLRPDTAAEFGRALRQAVIDSDRMGFDPRTTPPRLPGAGPSGHFPGQGAPVPASSADPNPESGSPRKEQPKSGSRQPHHGSTAVPGRDSGPQRLAGGAQPSAESPKDAGPTSGPQRFTGGDTDPNRRGNTVPQQRDSGPQRAVSGPQPTGQPQGLSKPVMYAIAAVVGLLLLGLIIFALTSGGVKVKQSGSGPAIHGVATTTQQLDLPPGGEN